MQEWRIIQKSLPDMIYIRVYENRINLLTIEKNRVKCTGRTRVGYYYKDDGEGGSSSDDDMAVTMNIEASIGNFVELLKLEKETTSFEAKMTEGNKGRNEIVKKVIVRIESILGLKKNNDTTGNIIVSN
ncbi:hypothetical protein TorRG33x02_229190 [Trema orientale]|uniref:Uncharacterized protein n=1 Tax=Trema orientale TaxID=63057 RepID=A0A2P5E6W1_TREOI|nr:hypothetical protein TorRG33x02_229190 [Trema orientale]